MNLDAQQKEEWKTIEEAPQYAVSNFGQVKRASDGCHTYAGRLLNQSINRSGYMICQLSNRRSAISNRHGKIWRCTHRLVLEAFIGKRPSKSHSCNHMDGNKANNNISNLEWVSISENNFHALRTGLRSNGLGDTSRNHLLKSGEVWLIKKLLHSKKLTQRFIAKMFKVHHGTIWDIKSGCSWSHVIFEENQ